jgi:hypothetical protein
MWSPSHRGKGNDGEEMKDKFCVDACLGEMLLRFENFLFC